MITLLLSFVNDADNPKNNEIVKRQSIFIFSVNNTLWSVIN